MNWILKNKNKSSKALLVVLFLVIVFGSFDVKNTFAYTSITPGDSEAVKLTKHKSNCTETGGSDYDNNTGKCIGCPADKPVADGDSCVAAADASYATAAPVQGGTIKDTADEAFERGVKAVLVGVQSFVIMLFGMATTLFAWVIEPANVSGPNGMLNKQAVKDVWIMVRDLLNMTFILILLFAAFCTIFQVEKWNLKKVWLNILINALLVNFSYPIARFFIDVSNVAFYYFVNNLFSTPGGTTVVSGSTIFAGYGAAARLGGILNPTDFSSQAIAYQIGIIIVLFIMGMTLLIIAALFVVRLVALTMLVMFSPVGFVGYIFPATQSYADDWWKKLFSYSFFAPVMIFIMAISLRIMKVMGDENINSFKQFANTNVANGQDANWIASAAFFAIPIIILWMGMGVAKSMGIEGADAVVGGAQKFSKWAGSMLTTKPAGLAWKGTKMGISAGAKKFDRDVLKSWSPRAFLEGWKANTKSKEDDHLSKGTGAWRDRLNKVWSRGKDKTHFGDAAFQATVLKKQKELSDVNQESEYLMSEYNNAMAKGDKKTMSAVLRMMFNNNDQNEFMKIQGKEVDPVKMKELIFEQLTTAGMSKGDAAKQLSDLSEIAVSKGNYANYGMASYDIDKGEFKITDKEDQNNASAGKAKNIKAQSKADSWHWNSFCIENEFINDSDIDKEGDNVVRDKNNEIIRFNSNGKRDKDGRAMRKVGRLHEVGEMQLKNITEAEIKSATRVRSDFYNILERKDEIDKFVNDLEKKDAVQADRIRRFITELQGGKDKEKSNEDLLKKKLADEPDFSHVEGFGS